MSAPESQPESQPQRPRRKRRICVYIGLALLAITVVSNWTWARLPGTPPAPAGSKYATVDGTKIHYVETSGREPAVVMIHGLPGSWGDFDRVAAQDQLKGRRTIRISRPGYAYSAPGYVPFERQVSLIHGLTEQLDLHDPVIAGHSYGGAIALRYGTRYGDDVSGVVAVAPGVNPDGIPTAKKIQARIVQASQLPVIKQLMDVTMSDVFRGVSARSGGNDAYSPDPREQDWLDRTLSLTMRDQDLKAWAQETFNWSGALSGMRAELAQTRAPVWVIQGRDDALIAAGDVRAMIAKDLPRANATFLPGGHMQTDVHPEVIAAAITDAARKRVPTAN